MADMKPKLVLDQTLRIDGDHLLTYAREIQRMTKFMLAAGAPSIDSILVETKRCQNENVLAVTMTYYF